MTDQVKEDETLEELQIRSASWYKQKLKYTQIIYETNEETALRQKPNRKAVKAQTLLCLFYYMIRLAH